MAETEFKLAPVDTRAGRIALVTIDNGEDWTKPTTFGRAALESLGRLLDEVEGGDWAGLLLTGKPFVFAAGADIDQFPNVTPELAREGSRAGHELFGRLRALPFPTLAAINGACLGGGLEIALHCDFRTISTVVRHFGCPEVFLGLFPAWGGTQLVPRLVGAEAAVKVLVENPLRQNRMLNGAQAHELGFADALLEPAEFVDESLELLLKRTGSDPGRDESVTIDPQELEDVVRRARARVEGETHGAARAPQVALDLIEGSARWSVEEGYRAEEDAIAELLPGPQAQASIYAFNLVERRAKKGVGIPEAPPRRIDKVGIVGAGLMATQLATLFLRRLEVPIVLRDVEQGIVDAALESIRGEFAGLAARGRYDEGKARFLGSLASGGTTFDGFEDCDVVLEAVVERMDVKQEVFADLRARVGPECVLATNTSSLSVAEMGADVGMHFFNPVAVLPLLEVIRTERTDDPSLATAFELARQLKKSAVLVHDSPAFVVNRVFARWMGEIMRSVDQGTSIDVADSSLVPLGLPMTPFMLLQLVGPDVAVHTAEAMHDAYPDRFPSPTGLRRLLAADGDSPNDTQDRGHSAEQVREAVLAALAQEARLMLDEGVVAEPQDIDLCLLLGAGWPFHLGGLLPYLDRSGISERVTGRRFLPPGVASVPAS
jgi:3-hydroxyacyl-CoA dehydrogenase/enoyl-CoA hydratase/carnithine racemase